MEALLGLAAKGAREEINIVQTSTMMSKLT
jgi:hypothetical protein